MIKIDKHSGMFTLRATQTIPVSLDQAWEFFSSPANLKVITPPYMGFDITSKELSKKMYPGQIISYKVSPILGIKTNWITEITHVRDKSYFVDEQRFGPYKMWHHEHFFIPVENGTEMQDIISYKLPMSSVSNIFHNSIVRPKLLDIFNFREQKVTEIFGKL